VLLPGVLLVVMGLVALRPAADPAVLLPEADPAVLLPEVLLVVMGPVALTLEPLVVAGLHPAADPETGRMVAHLPEVG